MPPHHPRPIPSPVLTPEVTHARNEDGTSEQGSYQFLPTHLGSWAGSGCSSALPRGVGAAARGWGDYSPLKLCLPPLLTLFPTCWEASLIPASPPFSLPAAFSNPFSPSVGSLFQQGSPSSFPLSVPQFSLVPPPWISSTLPSLRAIPLTAAGLSFLLRSLLDPFPGCPPAVPQTFFLYPLSSWPRSVALNLLPGSWPPLVHTPLTERLQWRKLPCRLTPGQPDAS